MTLKKIAKIEQEYGDHFFGVYIRIIRWSVLVAMYYKVGGQLGIYERAKEDIVYRHLGKSLHHLMISQYWI